MAKFYGSSVKTGRLGGSVFAIRNGLTVERQYQPAVANPKSTAQVAVRARLKLMSQLSAILGSVIAIRREGTVSPRNLFVKANFGQSTYDNEEASINLNNVTLTRGVVGLPDISTSREGTSVTVSMVQSVTSLVSRMVYIAVVKGGDNKLRLRSTAVVTEAGVDGRFSTTMETGATEVVILAYGVRDNTEAARVAFGNLEAVAAEQVAKLIVSRTLLETDVTLTETRGTTVVAGA